MLARLAALVALATASATALAAASATAQSLPGGQLTVPLVYNPAYAPSAVDLLTEGILRYDLFKTSINKFPLLGKALKSAKLEIALGKRAVFTGRGNTARAVHDRRLLGLKLDLGIDLTVPGLLDVDAGVGADLEEILDLSGGSIVDTNWGTTTTRLTNSQKDNAVSMADPRKHVPV